MKKNYLFSLLLAIPALALLLAVSTGPPAGYSGSPLDGQNCTACHLPGPAEEYANLITTNAPAEGYTPGETYTVTVTAESFPSERIGFQITTETPTDKAGTFIITDPARTKLVAPSTVTHTLAGTTPVGSPNSWTMDWTAPPNGTGPVTFAVAFNSSNNNGSNSGDLIYVSAFNLIESNTGMNELTDVSMARIYPNPVSDFINIEMPIKAQVRIFNISGQMMGSFESFGNHEKIDVSNFPAGRYFIGFSYEGQIVSRSFVKQ